MNQINTLQDRIHMLESGYLEFKRFKTKMLTRNQSSLIGNQ